ncbi:MAG: insulinase family protein [Luminiphilus sp.]|nr:insulinase family protein [Luminiphilus sp.]
MKYLSTINLRRSISGLFVVFFLLGCSQREDAAQTTATLEAESDPVSVIVSPNDSREYRSVSLANGIEVLLVSDPAVEKSAASLSVGVGLMFDPMEYQGMAHYLEHMLFMGTEAFPEVDAYMNFMSENGGSRNAYTWLDITNYMFEIKNSAYEGALDRFSHFFKTPLLDPEYIEKEKNAVNAEWSMRREMDYFGMFKLGRSFLGDHPANRFLIGNLESLADKPDSSLHSATVDFFDQYYSGNIMKVAMVSDRGLDQMEALARQYFSGVPNKAIAEPVVTEQIDMAAAAGKLVHYVPLEDQRMLQLDFLIDANQDKFRVKPNEYLAYILGSEMPNTPAARLKELGWASSLGVMASPNGLGNYGTFTVQIELTEAGMAQRPAIVDMVLGYIELLRAEGIDDRFASEFATSLDNRFRFLEKTNDFAYVSQLAEAMQSYPTLHAIDAPYRFEGFDADAVSSVLDQLVPERLNVWYVAKDEPATETMHFYAGKFSVEPLVLSSSAEQLALASANGLAMPALNTLLPESFAVGHADGDPVKVIDTDDAEFWLQGSATFPEQPKGFTQLQLNTGDQGKSPDATVLTALWADLYRQQQTILLTEASIAGMNASIAPGFGIQMSFSGFTDKQPELIKRSLEALQIQPSEEEFTQAVDRFTRGLENSRFGFPVRQLFPALRRLTQTGAFNQKDLLTAAKAATRGALSDHIQQQLNSAYVRGYRFGNYSEQDVEALAALVAQVLPNRSGDTYTRAHLYAPQANSTLIYQDSLPVEDLGMLYLFAAPQANIENVAKGELLAAHLSNRAFNQLRTEEQLGYAAGGFATQLGDHPMVGFYIQTPVKAPIAMLERFDRYRAEFVSDLEALGQAEFESIKAGVLTDLTQPPKNLAEEAGPFLVDWNRERYNFDTRARLIAAVGQVTLESVREYYADTVMTDAPSRVLVQLKGTAFAEEPFAKIEGAEVVEDVSLFHQSMPLQAH